MKKLEGRIRCAADKYNMIDDGDVIAVGLSGGKDSTALLAALCSLQKYYPKKFTVKAISCDMNFGGERTDFSRLNELCDSLGVEYRIIETEISEIVFDKRQEKNPCSLCAKMRRGALHKAAKEMGCNKIALGHHMDDAVETFMMNLLLGGRIDCFSPVTYLTDRDLFVLRPMILASEALIAGVVKRNNLPVVKSKCPMDKTSERAETKKLIYALNKQYPHLREKVIGALQKQHIDGW